MKIAVLGATGGTGVQIVKQALAGKHDVVAIVRNPDNLKEIQNPRLKVVNGDIFSEVSLTSLFKDTDAVISCLGFKRSSAVTGYTESIKPIIGAIRAAKVPRLLVMTAYYTEISSSESQGFLVRWLVIPMLRPILINMRQMEKYLETECGDINYTVIRPPGLTNGTASGRNVKSEIGAYFLKDKSSSTRMPRADVAKFMIDCLPKSDLFQKAVAIGI
ncbi:flavin reductase (NADPH)-like [Daphnia carinata]|uniref:flavin reductase (NADPH)-like n=1 Tax=Daphnia carinata TaxID=120202 RepID=UPI00257B7AE9|nr:flavin reductase (NADPH)-like [Daphnia carinata]